MTLAFWWLLFGTPLTATVFAAVGLRREWDSEPMRLMKAASAILTMAAGCLGCATLAYVQLVRPVSTANYRVEELGLLLTLASTILGLITLRATRWFSALTLAASAWMLALYFFLGSSY
jgi:hypothetical protein